MYDYVIKDELDQKFLKLHKIFLSKKQIRTRIRPDPDPQHQYHYDSRSILTERPFSEFQKLQSVAGGFFLSISRGYKTGKPKVH